MVVTNRLARGLGWFSIGLGAAQVAAPRRMARVVGVDADDTRGRLIRGIGVREVTAGAGILTLKRPSGWLWARVAGDAMDLALLGRALTGDPPKKRRVVLSTGAVLGVTVLDVLSSVDTARRSGEQHEHTPDVRQAITVNRSPQEVFHFWRDFTNLPSFMEHLESVQVTGERRSHWKALGPAGKTVEWDAEISDERPNELIAWRSLEGADVRNSGTVHFRPAPGGRGTEVRVEMRYDAPGGVLGKGVAALFGHAPEQAVSADLRRFKQVMETGEIARSEATVRPGPHPAQAEAA